eukprot:2981787-Amphidinium_carterae.1
MCGIIAWLRLSLLGLTRWTCPAGREESYLQRAHPLSNPLEMSSFPNTRVLWVYSMCWFGLQGQSPGGLEFERWQERKAAAFHARIAASQCLKTAGTQLKDSESSRRSLGQALTFLDLIV